MFEFEVYVGRFFFWWGEVVPILFGLLLLESLCDPLVVHPPFRKGWDILSVFGHAFRVFQVGNDTVAGGVTDTVCTSFEMERPGDERVVLPVSVYEQWSGYAEDRRVQPVVGTGDVVVLFPAVFYHSFDTVLEKWVVRGRHHHGVPVAFHVEPLPHEDTRVVPYDPVQRILEAKPRVDVRAAGYEEVAQPEQVGLVRAGFQGVVRNKDVGWSSQGSGPGCGP